MLATIAPFVGERAGVCLNLRDPLRDDNEYGFSQSDGGNDALQHDDPTQLWFSGSIRFNPIAALHGACLQEQLDVSPNFSCP